jgi:hypothetical protein
MYRIAASWPDNIVVSVLSWSNRLITFVLLNAGKIQTHNLPLKSASPFLSHPQFVSVHDLAGRQQWQISDTVL